MSAERTARLTIGLLFLALCPVPARSEVSAPDAWRCSLDGKYYSLEFSNGLRIAAIQSGTIAADIPRKINKKHRVTLEGRWYAGQYSGLMTVQRMEADYVAVQMLVPATGAAYSACTSRKSAILFSLGQPQPICNPVNVNWNRQPQVSAAEMASQELAQDVMTASTAAAAQQSDSNGAVDPQQSQYSPLVGRWNEVTSTYGTYTVITIDIRADGTYTATKKLRITAYPGSPTGGGTHDGRWRADGYLVHLSGDGNFPASSHNLQNFKRIS